MPGLFGVLHCMPRLLLWILKPEPFMQQRLEAFVRTFTQDTILAIPWPVQYGFLSGEHSITWCIGNFVSQHQDKSGDLISSDRTTAFVPYKGTGSTPELSEGYSIFPSPEEAPLIYKFAEM